MSLRNKIYISYILTTLLIGLIAVISGYYYSVRYVRREVISHIEVASTNKGEHINVYIDQLIMRVEHFSTDGIIKECLLFECSDNDLQQLREHLVEHKTAFEGINQVSILDDEGEIITSTSSQIPDEYLKSVDKKFITQPQKVNRSSEDSVMMIGVPIKHNDEQIGTMIAQVSAGRLYQIVAEKELDYDNAEVYITEGNLQEECNGQTREYTGTNSVKKIGTTYALASLNWCLVTEVSSSVYLSFIDDILRVYLVMPLVGVILLLLATIYIVKSLGKPLKQLQQGAAALRSGNLGFRINMKNGGELGEVASVFDKMAEELEKNKLQLETKVAERTKELDEATLRLEKQRTALINLLEDVSEEKQVEEQQSRKMFETIGEGIVLSDATGKITYVNPAFEKLSGFTFDELKGKEFATFFTAFDLQDQPLASEMLSNTAAVTAKNQETKLQLSTKDGRKVAIVINASPVHVDSEFKGVVRVIHDFSDDLELARQKDDFFSIASHDLRTPLTVISGNLDIILGGYGKSKLAKDDKQLLEDTMKASDRLIKLVNDFLNVSRLDQGRLKTDIRPIDSCAITKSVVDEIKSLAEEKEVKVNYSCTKDHNMAMADETLLKEILFNMIGNSIKFTEKGSIDIKHSRENSFIVTRIIDTGPGIDPDKQDLLFQRFQRATERTMERQVGGTGLGLYISREFARVMGGDLILEKSGLNEGSTFKILIPEAKNNPHVTTQQEAKKLAKESDEKDE